MFKHIPYENLIVTGNVAEFAEHCMLSCKRSDQKHLINAPVNYNAKSKRYHSNL
jgi:hypothetical protein